MINFDAFWIVVRSGNPAFRPSGPKPSALDGRKMLVMFKTYPGENTSTPESQPNPPQRNVFWSDFIKTELFGSSDREGKERLSGLRTLHQMANPVVAASC